MTSARLAVWLKHEGDANSAGEPIAEVETDKTTVELRRPPRLVLQRISAPASTLFLAEVRRPTENPASMVLYV